jgi:hypothetical protein
MEGFVWNGIGERDCNDPRARKHRTIQVGPLFAQIVVEPGGSKGVIDVAIIENQMHWQSWRGGEAFDIDRFLSKIVFYETFGKSLKDGELYPHPRAPASATLLDNSMVSGNFKDVLVPMEKAYALQIIFHALIC